VASSALLLLITSTLAQAAQRPGGFDMTPEQFWRTPFGTDPRMPLVGDADGDGHADLISLWPKDDGVVDLVRTSALGKPFYGNVAMRNFGKNAIGDACGPLVRKDAADLMGIYADGSVRIAWGMPVGTNAYQHNDLAAQIPPDLIPKVPIKTTVADFDGDGLADVVTLDANGSLLLLHNTRGSETSAHCSVHAVKTKLPGVRQFSAGVFGGGKGEVVWLDGTGSVYRAFITPSSDGSADLSTPVLVTKASPEDHLVAGHFQGKKESDILVGQRLLPGGDAHKEILLKNLPSLDVAKGDGPWFAAGLVGNGMDDLIRYRRGKERFGGQDVYVHFPFDDAHPDKGYFCSSNDGLLDIWKTGKINPNGLDLREMGCQLGHRDIIVDIERFDDVSLDYVKKNLERVTKYFGSLPIKNPDGTTGIAMHYIFANPIPKAKRDDVNRHFDEMFPPSNLRGIAHTMFAENNGPLVSRINGDRGRYNGGPLEFIHEFGHQLDLTHSGFWDDDECALYPSLMNYSYSYSLNDTSDDAGYSDGARASFTVNPLHLPKLLPFPLETVKFLSGAQYHFHLKPTDDGKGTFVDWNWDGVFDDEAVVADVRYSHGSNIGPRHVVGQTQCAPVLVSDESTGKKRILLIYGQTSANGLKLLARTWLGENRDSEGDRWSEATVIVDSGVLGDPTAAYVKGGSTWVSYATADGVFVKRITIDADGTLQAGATKMIPRTQGFEPTVTAFDGQLALVLWHDANSPVEIRVLKMSGDKLAGMSKAVLNLESAVPLGAVAGSVGSDGPSLWICRREKDDELDKTHNQLVRFVQDSDGIFKEAESKLVFGGYASHRMTILWEPEKGLGPTGRIYQIAEGLLAPDRTWSESFITMNVPYPDHDGGWLDRRYLETDFTTPSAVGACFYNDNIICAFRLHDSDPARNDSLAVYFYGNGATPALMGDFDDIGHIRDFGMSRSIRRS
jgi:hypothetical protein